MKFVYPAIFTPSADDPGYTVVVPDLPGCVTEGDTLLEAIDMGVDAASGWILGELEDGNPFPQPSAAESVDVPNGSFLNLLVLDMDAYAEQYGNKAVRRNITIPAWLDTYIHKNNLSLSRVVQDSLIELVQSNHAKNLR